ncbi:MAG: DNA mismatch repair endonuclease MutH [Pseudomonadota bacterium]
MSQKSPVSKSELLDRAKSLSGLTLAELAKQLNIDCPASSKDAKGWVGNILENILGATASTAPEPDFVELGIELKSIPIGRNGKPKESTYVCVVQFSAEALSSWDHSLVKKKLSHVLWIPYETDPAIPFTARHIGNPILWQPDDTQIKKIKHDWQEFSDMIRVGRLHEITAEAGQYLQIRPKAAHSRMLTRNFNLTDQQTATMPRGYYLRAGFTAQIIQSSI